MFPFYLHSSSLIPQSQISPRVQGPASTGTNVLSACVNTDGQHLPGCKWGDVSAGTLSAGIAWHRNPVRTAQWFGHHKILPHTSQSMESRKESKEDAARKLGASAVWTGTRTNTHKKHQWNKIPMSKEPLGPNHLQLMLKLAKHLYQSKWKKAELLGSNRCFQALKS